MSQGRRLLVAQGRRFFSSGGGKKGAVPDASPASRELHAQAVKSHLFSLTPAGFENFKPKNAKPKQGASVGTSASISLRVGVVLMTLLSSITDKKGVESDGKTVNDQAGELKSQANMVTAVGSMLALFAISSLFMGRQDVREISFQARRDSTTLARRDFCLIPV